MNNDGVIYCPICQRHIVAVNREEVREGLADAYVFLHDTLDEHTDEELEAIEHGVN